jgi:hypothetical protein
MFNLFSKKNDPQCPINQDLRLWMENAFLWIATQFGHDYIKAKAMLYPTPECFPIPYDGSKESLLRTAAIVAQQMEVDFAELNIQTYQQSIQEFQGDLGHRIFTEVDKHDSKGMSSGLYFGKNEFGRYDIFIEEQNLSDPEAMVAVLAHEFSHIKLLGENRMQENHEHLTDLFTVVFGLGIFNANASFKEIKTADSWGHNSLGYLSQQEWGYALALYTHFREEENPDWIRFLKPNLKSDFQKSRNYIFANMDKIFWEDYNGENPVG